MNRSRVWFSIAICVISPLLIGACGTPEEHKSGDDLEAVASQSNREESGVTTCQARIHRAGEVTPLPLEPAERADLLHLVQTLAGNTKTMLRLAISPERMAEYYKLSHALELDLGEPISLEIGFNKQVIEPSRLFIMYRGELVGEAGDGLVIIHGYPEYSAGPLVVPGGRGELLAKLTR